VQASNAYYTTLDTCGTVGAYKKLDPNIIAIIKFKFTSELKVGTNPIDKWSDQEDRQGPCLIRASFASE